MPRQWRIASRSAWSPALALVQRIRRDHHLTAAELNKVIKDASPMGTIQQHSPDSRPSYANRHVKLFIKL